MKPTPFWNYSDVAILLGAVPPSFLVAAAVTLLVRLLYPHAALSAPEALLSQGIAYGGIFSAMVWIFRQRYGLPFWESISWAGERRAVARYMFLGPMLAIAVMVAGVFIETPNIDMPMRNLLNTPLNIALMGIFAITAGPLCEELLFRGFLQPLLSKTFGAVIGIVSVASLFGLLHLPEYGYSWRHGVLIGLAGIGFGWARFRTGSTAASTMMHATYNLTVFTAFLVGQGDKW